jgi:hypothetical protein
MKLSTICAYSDEVPEMGFLDINLIKDSRLVLSFKAFSKKSNFLHWLDDFSTEYGNPEYGNP